MHLLWHLLQSIYNIAVPLSGGSAVCSTRAGQQLLAVLVLVHLWVGCLGVSSSSSNSRSLQGPEQQRDLQHGVKLGRGGQVCMLVLVQQLLVVVLVLHHLVMVPYQQLGVPPHPAAPRGQCWDPWGPCPAVPVWPHCSRVLRHSCWQRPWTTAAATAAPWALNGPRQRLERRCSSSTR